LKTKEEKYEKEADRTFRSFAAAMKAYGQGSTTMAQALDLWIEGKEAKSEKNPPKQPKEKQVRTWQQEKFPVEMKVDLEPVDPEGLQKGAIFLTIKDDCWVYANPCGLEDYKYYETKVEIKTKDG